MGALLAPGGDYDESQITPQLMAYLTRLSIYENDHTKPQMVDGTNSTFKKYSTSNHNDQRSGASPDEDDRYLAMDEDSPQWSMDPQNSNTDARSRYFFIFLRVYCHICEISIKYDNISATKYQKWCGS